MSIPVLRHFKYDDDGVSIWECLNCYRGYGVRTYIMDWAFCPHCGIKFTSVMPEDLKPEKPAWKYHKTPATREWVIQNRCTIFDDDPDVDSLTGWSDVITLDYPQFGAKSLLWWIEREKKNSYVEYRYFIRDKT